jgi:hypothetical protein
MKYGDVGETGGAPKFSESVCGFVVNVPSPLLK